MAFSRACWLAVSSLFALAFLPRARCGLLTEIFRYDCSGKFTLNPGGALESSFESMLFVNFQRHLHKRISAIAADACPGVTTEELERRVIPSLPWVMNWLSSEPDQTTECAGKIADSLHGLGPFLGALNIPKITLKNLPRTCTYDSVLNGDGCAMQLKSTAERLDDAEFSVDVAFAHCPGQMLPYFSLRTSGDLFNKIAKPCTQDSQCGKGMSCLHLSDVQEIKIDDITNIIMELLKSFGMADESQALSFVDEVIKLTLDEMGILIWPEGVVTAEADSRKLLSFCAPAPKRQYSNFVEEIQDRADREEDFAEKLMEEFGLEGYDDMVKVEVDESFSGYDGCVETGRCSILDGLNCDENSLGCKAIKAGCHPEAVGNGYCDEVCNVRSFNYDGGDCESHTFKVQRSECEDPETFSRDDQGSLDEQGRICLLQHLGKDWNSVPLFGSSSSLPHCEGFYAEAAEPEHRRSLLSSVTPRDAFDFFNSTFQAVKELLNNQSVSNTANLLSDGLDNLATLVRGEEGDGAVMNENGGTCTWEGIEAAIAACGDACDRVACDRIVKRWDTSRDNVCACIGGQAIERAALDCRYGGSIFGVNLAEKYWDQCEGWVAPGSDVPNNDAPESQPLTRPVALAENTLNAHEQLASESSAPLTQRGLQADGCRGDICSDIGADCCAPGDEQRGCSEDGYTVQPGGTFSSDWCRREMGESAIYQCCPVSAGSHVCEAVKTIHSALESDVKVSITFSRGLLSSWDGVTDDGLDVFDKEFTKISETQPCSNRVSKDKTHWQLIKHDCDGTLAFNIFPDTRMYSIGWRSLDNFLDFAWSKLYAFLLDESYRSRIAVDYDLEMLVKHKDGGVVSGINAYGDVASNPIAPGFWLHLIEDAIPSSVKKRYKNEIEEWDDFIKSRGDNNDPRAEWGAWERAHERCRRDNEWETMDCCRGEGMGCRCADRRNHEHRRELIEILDPVGKGEQRRLGHCCNHEGYCSCMEETLGENCLHPESDPDERTLKSTLSTLFQDLVGEFAAEIPETCSFQHTVEDGKACMLEWDVLPEIISDFRASDGTRHTLNEVVEMAYAPCEDGFLPEFVVNLNGDYTALLHSLTFCEDSSECSGDGQTCAVLLTADNVEDALALLDLDPISSVSYMNFKMHHIRERRTPASASRYLHEILALFTIVDSIHPSFEVSPNRELKAIGLCMPENDPATEAVKAVPGLLDMLVDKDCSEMRGEVARCDGGGARMCSEAGCLSRNSDYGDIWCDAQSEFKCVLWRSDDECHNRPGHWFEDESWCDGTHDRTRLRECMASVPDRCDIEKYLEANMPKMTVEEEVELTREFRDVHSVVGLVATTTVEGLGTTVGSCPGVEDVPDVPETYTPIDDSYSYYSDGPNNADQSGLDNGETAKTKTTLVASIKLKFTSNPLNNKGKMSSAGEAAILNAISVSLNIPEERIVIVSIATFTELVIQVDFEVQDILSADLAGVKNKLQSEEFQAGVSTIIQSSTAKTRGGKPLNEVYSEVEGGAQIKEEKVTVDAEYEEPEVVEGQLSKGAGEGPEFAMVATLVFACLRLLACPRAG